jgi:hypothetical protein
MSDSQAGAKLHGISGGRKSTFLANKWTEFKKYISKAGYVLCICKFRRSFALTGRAAWPQSGMRVATWPTGIQSLRTLYNIGISFRWRGIVGIFPSLLCTPNNGNTAAKLLRRNAFAANALAAYRGYASTKKVMMPWNTRNTLDFVEKLVSDLLPHRLYFHTRGQKTSFQ